jgi:hypothetical protein
MLIFAKTKDGWMLFDYPQFIPFDAFNCQQGLSTAVGVISSLSAVGTTLTADN